MQSKPSDNTIAIKDSEGGLSYGELKTLSDGLAAKIRDLISQDGDAVAVLLPRVKEFVLAGWACFKSRAAYLPLDDAYPRGRIGYILQDACAQALITTHRLYEEKAADYPIDRVIFIDDGLHASGSHHFEMPTDSAEHTAMILYTSGTTGRPKGVVYHYKALACLFDHFFKDHFPHPFTPHSKVAVIASFCFIGSVPFAYGPLFVGGQAHVISADMKMDIPRLHAYITNNDITHIFLPPGMSAVMLENYDLSNVVVIQAGERAQNFKLKVQPEAQPLIYNMYGLTEGAPVAWGRITGDEDDIPIGHPTDGTTALLVNKDLTEVADGETGELIYHADYMASEYLGDKAKTDEAWFMHDGKRFFHTGDLMRKNDEGALVFVERADFLIKLNGQRIDPAEVEERIRNSSFGSKMSCRVCVDKRFSGRKVLCLYYKAKNPIDEDRLKEELSHDLVSYMIPEKFIRLEAFPLNANGKIDRSCLPDPQWDADLVYKTSLEAMAFVADIYERYKVKISYENVLGVHKKSELEEIERSAQKRSRTTKLKPQKALGTKSKDLPTDSQVLEAPLAFSQLGVYTDCVALPGTTGYNLSALIKIPEDKDDADVRSALVRVMRAHPCLAIRIYTGDDGAPLQRIDTDFIDNFECGEKALSSEEFKDPTSLMKPFDVNGEEPLFRATILHVEGGQRYLFTDIHHLIFDGVSYGLFIGDLKKALDGDILPSSEYGLLTLAHKQQQLAGSRAWKDYKAYWDGCLAVSGAMTSLMPDLYETKNQQGEEHRVDVRMPLKPIRDYAAKHGVRSSSVYLAAALYTIAAFTSEDNIGIVMVSGSRQRADIAKSYGMFVNTLPFTCKIPGGTISAFVKEISQLTGELIRYDAYPFSQTAKDHHIHPQIMFACQESLFNGAEEREEGLKCRFVEKGVAKFPLFIEVVSKGADAELRLRYDSCKFSREMMLSFLDCFKQVTGSMLSCKRLEEISFISDEKQKSIMSAAVDAHRTTYDGQSVLSLIQQSFASYADNLAVSFKDTHLTYRGIDDRSQRLARLISHALNTTAPTSTSQQKENPKREPVVAILVPRNEYIVIAPLAAMRAGCAYQPIDPAYPDDRIDVMLEDSAAEVIITTPKLKGRLKNSTSAIICTGDELTHDTNNPKIRRDNTANVSAKASSTKAKITPESLFILLYTSGSTGKPKGVMLEHGNLVHFIRWYNKYYDLDQQSRVAAYASFGFDACMMDVYPALAAGASVHIVPEEKRLDLDWIESYFSKAGITHSFMTTQVCCQFARRYHPKSLKHLSGGGEKMETITPSEGFALYNGYGPTECTIFSTIYRVDKREENIPIGKPVDALGCLVVDSAMRLLPKGALGELVIVGGQVGRGYLNLPDKTKEAFFSLNGVRAYHSGDIVRLKHDGNIEYVSRADRQVKIRGFRIEPQEIEGLIRSFEGIEDVVVCAFDEAEGGQYLAAYVVSHDRVDIEALKRFILSRKPSYMLPKHIMQIKSIPSSSNQKVDISVLPVPEATKEEYLEPEGDIQIKIVAAMEKVLGAGGKISRTDDFISLGGDSLRAIAFIAELKEAGITLGSRPILQGMSVESLSKEAITTDLVEISQEPFVGFVKDTPIIKYFKSLNLKNPEWFHQSFLFKARARVDVANLKEALSHLIQTHDILRAHFKDARLYVPESCDLIVDEYDASDLLRITTELSGSIDLKTGPLFRFALFHDKDADYLYIVIHHALIDGVSWRIILSDLNCVYKQLTAGEKVSLPQRTHSYAYYSEKLADYASSKHLCGLKPYWDKVQSLLKELPASTQERKLSTYHLNVSAERSKALFSLCQGGRTNANDVLVCAVLMAYHHYTHEDGASVLFESHGRQDFDKTLRTERTVGWFTCLYSAVFQDLSSSVEDKMSRTRDTLNRIPDGGLGYQLLYDTAEQPHPLITFNYLGEMTSQSQGSEAFELSFNKDVAPMIDPANEYGTDINVNSLSVASELKFEISFNTKRYTDGFDGFIDALDKSIDLLVDYAAQNRPLPKIPADFATPEINYTKFQDIMLKLKEQNEELLDINALNDRQYERINRYIRQIDNTAHTHSEIFEINGTIPEEILNASLAELYDLHEELRMVAVYDETGAFYAIVTDKKPAIDIVTLPEDISDSEAYTAVLASQTRMKMIPHRIMRDAPLKLRYIKSSETSETSENKSYLIAAIYPVLFETSLYISLLGELFSRLHTKMSQRSDLGDLVETIELAATKLKEKERALTKGSQKSRQLMKDISGRLSQHGSPDDLYVYNDDPSLPKLIFVHTMNTGSEAYYLLAKKLEGKRSFAVLEQYNLLHPNDRIYGVKNIAEKYIEIIKEFQPKGPYHLGGWCYGGLIAYEMAQQLKEAGDAVDELIMFDTHIIDDPDLRKDLLSSGQESMKDYLSSADLFEDMRKKGLFGQLVENSRATMVSWLSYEPEPYEGKVLYFKAIKCPENVDASHTALYDYVMKEKAAGFERRVSKDNLTIVTVPTDHDSMMNETSLAIIVPYLIDPEHAAPHPQE